MFSGGPSQPQARGDSGRTAVRRPRGTARCSLPPRPRSSSEGAVPSRAPRSSPGPACRAAKIASPGNAARPAGSARQPTAALQPRPEERRRPGCCPRGCPGRYNPGRGRTGHQRLRPRPMSRADRGGQRRAGAPWRASHTAAAALCWPGPSGGSGPPAGAVRRGGGAAKAHTAQPAALEGFGGNRRSPAAPRARSAFPGAAPQRSGRSLGRWGSPACHMGRDPQ